MIFFTSDNSLWKLSNQIRTHTFHCICDVWEGQSNIEFLHSIILKLNILFSEPGDNLNDTIPNIVFDFSVFDKIDNHIHIPSKIFSKLFSQNGNLQHKIISNEWIISVLQIPQKLCNNFWGIVRVTDKIQQIQWSSSDWDISILQICQNLVLVLWEVMLESQSAHGLQT